MPYINILEVDKSFNPSYATDSNIVFIPGFMGTTTSDGSTAGSGTIDKPTLCTTVAEFTAAFGSFPKEFSSGSPIVYKEDIAWVMAYELISGGMQVLYMVPGTSTSSYATAVASEAEMLTAISADHLWDMLKDRGSYDVRFLTCGGVSQTLSSESGSTVTLNAAVAGAMGVANARGDCSVLVDHASTETDASDIMAQYQRFSSTAGVKYGKGFTPWVKVTQIAPKSANFSGSIATLPGSYGYLRAFANSIYNNNAVWLAAAGATRGQIPKIVGTTVAYGEAAANDFQTRASGEIAVNPICMIEPYGYVVWGNRTMFPNDSTGLKASSFANIRELVSSLKKALYVASKGLTFEQNNDLLWFNFRSLLTPTLDKMASGGGIQGYRIIKEATTARATLKARIRIVPIEGVEDFDLTVELSDSVDKVTE